MILDFAALLPRTTAPLDHDHLNDDFKRKRALRKPSPSEDPAPDPSDEAIKATDHFCYNNFRLLDKPPGF